MKKQYTVTERNDWEGETFGYIMELNEDEAKFIEENIQESEFFTIKESNYTKDEVQKINDHCENTYLPRLGFYTFKKPMLEMIADEKYRNSLDTDCGNTWEEDGYSSEEHKILETEIFYKAIGLKEV